MDSCFNDSRVELFRTELKRKNVELSEVKTKNSRLERDLTYKTRELETVREEFIQARAAVESLQRRLKSEQKNAADQLQYWQAHIQKMTEHGKILEREKNEVEREKDALGDKLEELTSRSRNMLGKFGKEKDAIQMKYSSEREALEDALLEQRELVVSLRKQNEEITHNMEREADRALAAMEQRHEQQARVEKLMETNYDLQEKHARELKSLEERFRKTQARLTNEASEAKKSEEAARQALDDIKTNLSKENEDLMKQLNDARTETAGSRKKLHQENKRLERELATAKTDLKNSAIAYKDTMESTEARYREQNLILKEKIAAIEKNRSMADTDRIKLAKMQLEKASLHRVSVDMRKENNRLLEKLNHANIDLETKYKKATEDLNECRTQKNTVANERDAIFSRLSSCLDKITQLSFDRSNFQAMASEGKRAKEDLEKDLEALKHDYVSKDMYTQLALIHEEKCTELTKLRNFVEKSVGKMISLEEYASLKEHIQRKNLETAELSLKNEQLTSQASTLRREINESKLEVERITEILTQERMRGDQLKGKTKNLDEKNDELTEFSERTSSLLRQREMDVNKLTRELASTDGINDIVIEYRKLRRTLLVILQQKPVKDISGFTKEYSNTKKGEKAVWIKAKTKELKTLKRLCLRTKKEEVRQSQKREEADYYDPFLRNNFVSERIKSVKSPIFSRSPVHSLHSIGRRSHNGSYHSR